tara:strand:+ start:1096 stop:1863 length:768 start_codon:yes stop_codon:yes gene_type:complete
MGLFDGLASTLIGGGLSYLGSRNTASAATKAAEAQSAAMLANAQAAQEAGQPWNVGSVGGTAAFDPDSQSALLGLSPELQEIYQGALSRSGIWGEQAGMYGADPFAAADTLYEQQQQYWQPKEDQMRTDAETRLMAQGRLGGTGGARAMGELNESILGSQQQRRTQSMNQAQNMITQLLGRESGDIGTATGLLNIPLQYGNMGRGIGGTLGTQATNLVDSRNDAASNINKVNAISPMGTTLSSLGGLFMNPKRGT